MVLTRDMSPCLDDRLCQIIFISLLLKTMPKCRSYGPEKLNLYHFIYLTFKCDLDLQPTGTNVSNGTFTPQGEQLCQIILKTMCKGRSFGPDKLNLSPFYH